MPTNSWFIVDARLLPFSIARFTPATVTGRQKLELTVEALARPVASVEFTLLDPSHTVLQHVPLDVAQPWQLTPLTESGEAAGAIVEGSGAVTISQPARLALEFTSIALAHGWPAANEIEIRLLDRDKQLVGSLRLAE